MGHYERASDRRQLLLSGFEALSGHLDPNSELPPFWDLEGIRLHVSEHLDTSLSYDYQLRSDTISGELKNLPRVGLVPIAPISQDGLAIPPHEAVVSTGFQERTVQPREVKPEDDSAGIRRPYLGLLMNASEYASSPHVSLTARVPNRARFSARDFITTVGFVEVGFIGLPPAEISVHLPPDATFDRVAVTVLVNLDGVEDTLNVARLLFDKARKEQMPQTVGFRRLIIGYAVSIKALLDDLEAGIPLATRPTPSVASTQLKKAVESILATESPRRANREAKSRQSDSPFEYLDKQLESLTSAVKSGRCEYTFVLESSGGRIPASALVDITLRLHSSHDEENDGAWHGSEIGLEISRLLVPFTMERDPQIHRLRTSAVLGLLALTLAIPGFVLLPEFWGLPVPEAALGLHYSVLAPDPILPNSLRGPLATLLLLFPAALYSQFLQFRPGTSISSRARGGTYMLLSLLFALPIVPAGLIAAGGSFKVAVILLLGLALVTLAAAVWTWLALRDTAMERRRRKAVSQAGKHESEQLRP